MFSRNKDKAKWLRESRSGVAAKFHSLGRFRCLLEAFNNNTIFYAHPIIQTIFPPPPPLPEHPGDPGQAGAGRRAALGGGHRPDVWLRGGPPEWGADLLAADKAQDLGPV